MTGLEWFVITRDEEGDVGSLIGPFLIPGEARAFIEQNHEMGDRLGLCEMTVRDPWPPGDWVADRQQILVEWDAEDATTQKGS